MNISVTRLEKLYSEFPDTETQRLIVVTWWHIRVTDEWLHAYALTVRVRSSLIATSIMRRWSTQTLRNSILSVLTHFLSPLYEKSVIALLLHGNERVKSKLILDIKQVLRCFPSQ